MSNQADLARELYKQGKFKKALQLAKKVNKKRTSQTLSSLEIEGLCLFHNKQFKLSEIVLHQALQLAETLHEKKSVLQNLQAAAFHSNNISALKDYLQQSVKLDPSPDNADMRFKLCEVALQQEDYVLVLEYAQKLLLINHYSSQACFMLYDSYQALEQPGKALTYLQKLIGEAHLLESAHVEKLLILLKHNSQPELKQKLLARTLEKFGHEQWYQQGAVECSGTHAIDGEATIPDDFVVGEPELVESIQRLLKLLEQRGAFFHPLLRIKAEAGNLSILSFSEPEKAEKLMAIPLNCLPLLQDYDFSLSPELKLSVQMVSSPLSPGSKEIMNEIIHIYNKTDKIKAWYEVFPFLALRHSPELLSKLVDLRKYDQSIQDYKALFDSQNWLVLAMSSFLGSRKFNFTPEELKAMGVDSNGRSKEGLLAVIDFLNHKVGRPGYQIDQGAKELQINSFPDFATNEVFVQYNIYDPVITLMNYGFVDVQAPWLFSVSAVLQTNHGLKIELFNQSAAKKEQVSGKEIHIGRFLPDSVVREGTYVMVNRIIIPDLSNITVLCQVLEHLLHKVDWEGIYESPAYLARDVESLEQQIVSANIQYWREFKGDVDMAVITDENIPQQTKDNLYALQSFCIGHLTAYANRRGISLM